MANTYKLKMIPYCGSMVRQITTGLLADCRAAARRFRDRHQRDGGNESILKPGFEWELETPDTAFMVSDDEGYLKIQVLKEAA
jgi:hypothetical protein